jgi:predicted branched-subunit amino acid permease
VKGVFADAVYSAEKNTMVLGTSPKARRLPPFIEGCHDAVPICVSFAFLFFSAGSLCTTYGYSPSQAAAMTALIFAAPLQVFIVQNGDSISVMALVVASVLINFRFLIMSSALSEKFKGVPLKQLLLSIPMLSASTFAVANSKTDEPGPVLFKYYLGIGAAAISTAIVATVIGSIISAKSTAYVTDISNMILPTHFAALTGLMWPKLRPLLLTILSFFIAPIAGYWLGKWQVLIVPLLMASLFLLWDKQTGHKSR